MKNLFAIGALLIVAYIALSFYRSKPTGPVTAGELTSLTNIVQGITSEPILRIEEVAKRRLFMVYTGATENQHPHLLERTRFSWRIVPIKNKP
jgi:hypothetical protein